MNPENAHIQSYRGIAYESAMNAMKNPRHLNSLLHTVLSTLRSLERPVSMQEIFRLTQIDLSKNAALVTALKANMKITFENGHFEYKVSTKRCQVFKPSVFILPRVYSATLYPISDARYYTVLCVDEIQAKDPIRSGQYPGQCTQRRPWFFYRRITGSECSKVGRYDTGSR